MAKEGSAGLPDHETSLTNVGVSMMPAPASKTVEQVSPMKSDETTCPKKPVHRGAAGDLSLRNEENGIYLEAHTWSSV